VRKLLNGENYSFLRITEEEKYSKFT